MVGQPCRLRERRRIEYLSRTGFDAMQLRKFRALAQAHVDPGEVWIREGGGTAGRDPRYGMSSPMPMAWVAVQSSRRYEFTAQLHLRRMSRRSLQPRKLSASSAFLLQGMDSFSINTRFTVADWRAYAQACAARVHTHASTNRQYVRLIVFILIGLSFAAVGDRMGVPLQVASLLAGMGLLVVSLMLNARTVQRHQVPEEQGQFLAPLVLDFQPEGLHVIREGSRSFTSWSRVSAVTATAAHIFLWVDRMNAHIVPLRDLPADLSAVQLQAWLAERIAHGTSTSSSPGLLPQAEAAQDMSAIMSSTPVSWPRALLRLLTLRRTAVPVDAPTTVIVVLAALSLGVWIVVDWFANQPDPAFYIYGLPSLGWYVLLMLLLAAILARRAVPRVEFGRALILVLAATPLVIVATRFVETLITVPTIVAATLAALLYFVSYAARSMVSTTGSSQPNAISLALLIVVLFVPATNDLYVEPSLWAAVEDEPAGDAQPSPLVEPLLFSQAARIDEAVDSLVVAEGAGPAAFFLGFAGMGEQRVFAEEIKLAGNVIGTGYGSGERSILLLNDSRDLESHPLASPTALRYALSGIASKMDIERDVLFLSLSSHGSQDATISVSNGPLMLQDLSAADLADALDASGIQWRVIIVSACYSGSFIAPLKNSHTAVITASSADRTSFGCSDDRDLTYFGEAFYRDALPKATSLRGAFEAARDDIKQREHDESITASRPQAFFGADIETHLQLLQSIHARGGLP